MKRLFSIFLVIVLMVTMAVPCFTASEEDARTTTGVTYDSTSDDGSQTGRKYPQKLSCVAGKGYAHRCSLRRL